MHCGFWWQECFNVSPWSLDYLPGPLLPHLRPWRGSQASHSAMHTGRRRRKGQAEDLVFVWIISHLFDRERILFMLGSLLSLLQVRLYCLILPYGNMLCLHHGITDITCMLCLLCHDVCLSVWETARQLCGFVWAKNQPDYLVVCTNLLVKQSRWLGSTTDKTIMKCFGHGVELSLPCHCRSEFPAVQLLN